MRMQFLNMVELIFHSFCWWTILLRALFEGAEWDIKWQTSILISLNLCHLVASLNTKGVLSSSNLWIVNILSGEILSGASAEFFLKVTKISPVKGNQSISSQNFDLLFLRARSYRSIGKYWTLGFSKGSCSSFDPPKVCCEKNWGILRKILILGWSAHS